MMRRVVAALVGMSAYLLYRSTLLPGFDLGDTPSFQVMAGEPVITPRDGYPLYYALARLFVWSFPGDPAQVLNLVSALEAAAACAVIVLLASELSGSVAAGLAAALLFAGSYTFWSQAIIAEVYGLHMLFVALTLLLLLRWSRAPTFPRLAAFVAVYALGFGNHLTMVLLAPAYAMFVMVSAPGGWRSVLDARTLTVVALVTAAAALQYLWNFRALWLAPLPPRDLADALSAFWFDVTKADWRESMMVGVYMETAGERLRMYAFDLRQQFGWATPVVALAGAIRLLRTSPSRAWLLLTIYVVTMAFALSYNVGDAYVFFLPAHLVIALLIAPAIVWIGTAWRWRAAVPLAAGTVIVFAATRIYADYPALDRSGDHRPRELLDALTAGLDDTRAVLLTDLNWQVQNGLTYYGKRTKTDLAYARMPDVLLYAPALIRDNLAIGREVALTERASASLAAAYGPLYSIASDPRVVTPALSDLARSIPSGMRYVLCALRPTGEIPARLDRADLASSVQALTGGRLSSLEEAEFSCVAGRAGRPPAFVHAAAAPFRRAIDLDGVPVTVRMDSWLGFDTIRRMGFGHVIANRRHTLIVERGVSFVAFDETGAPHARGYAAGIFAPQPRYLVRSADVNREGR